MSVEARDLTDLQGDCHILDRSGTKYWSAVQYLLLARTLFEVCLLGFSIHGGTELETPKRN
jgi:hypothetical protein